MKESIIYWLIAIACALGIFNIVIAIQTDKVRVDTLNPKLFSIIQKHKEENHRLRGLLEEITGHKGNFTKFSIQVTATAYTAREVECDATPEVTASMTPSRVGVLAISQDLERDFNLSFGDRVFIKDLGMFIIEDRMNPRWERRVDILHGNLKAARLFSKRKVTLFWFGG